MVREGLKARYLVAVCGEICACDVVVRLGLG